MDRINLEAKFKSVLVEGSGAPAKMGNVELILDDTKVNETQLILAAPPCAKALQCVVDPRFQHKHTRTGLQGQKIARGRTKRTRLRGLREPSNF